MFNNVNGQDKQDNKVDDIFAETDNSPAAGALPAKEEPVNIGSSGLSSIAGGDGTATLNKKKMSPKAIVFIAVVILVVALTAYLAYSKFFTGREGEPEQPLSGNNAGNQNNNGQAPVIQQEPVVGSPATSTATSTVESPVATSTPIQQEPLVGEIVATSTATSTVTVEAGMDSDSDALSDIEEQMLGTDLANPDTDGDGLSDYEEIKVYNSNPLLPDTDGDGYSDLEEIRNGYNPNGPGKLGV